MSELRRILNALRPGRLVPIFHFFSPYLRPHRKALSASVALTFLSVCLVVAQPWPLKLVFDYILHYKRKHAETLPFYDLFSEDKRSGMMIICGMVLGIAIARAVIEYFQVLLTTRVGQRVVQDLRAGLFDHLQKLSISFHTRARSGDLLMRLTGDINLLRELLVVLMITLFSNVMMIVLVLSVMFYLDVKLTLIALSIIPALAFVTVYFSIHIRQATRRQRRKESEVSVTAHEALIGMRVIQAYNREGASRKVFERQNRQSFREGMRAARMEVIAAQWVEVLLAIGTMLVLWFGVEQARGEHPTGTPGDLIVYFFYLRAIYKPIREFSKLGTRAAKAGASAERVMEILKTEPDIQDFPGAVAAPQFGGHIVFENVSFAYDPEHPILKNVSFEIMPGETVALVGASGAGKSTLCSLLLRFYEPTSGRITIDGVDVREFTLRSLRRHIALVLQESLLFGASIYENLAFGKPDANAALVQRAAKRAQAHKFIMKMPDGYDTVIAERGLSLSEGQKQRLALGRAFLKRAPILILDEPTSNVDVRSERSIIRAIKKLIEGTTTILVTHNIKMIHFADRILVIEEGELVENGTHHDLMKKDGRYARMIGMQTDLGTAGPLGGEHELERGG
ncbi:MAG: ABC transporter ATP-binding protein [Candidatus Sumerlaeaceae bacterium]